VLYVEADGDTKLAVDQPSLLFDSYDKPEIGAVGRELDGLLAGTDHGARRRHTASTRD